MKKINSFLHPNHCDQKNKNDELNQSKEFEANAYLGTHCIMELYECDHEKLNDELYVRSVLISAAKVAGATLLNLMTYRFKPQGVTGIALLAESHISIHTWPESRYAAIDVFTCGKNTQPEKACNALANDFFAEKYSLKTLMRKTPSELNNIQRLP